MGFRFHRSLKLLPGVRLNFGKRGVSTSIGVRGVHVTFGKSGTRTTVGLPGTGFSYTHLERPDRVRAWPPVAYLAPSPGATRSNPWRGLLWTALIIVIVFSAVLSHLARS
jgi:hypothetical protein